MLYWCVAEDKVNNWIRLFGSEGLRSESWHLQFGTSPRGLRVAECGYGYPPEDELETRPFGDPPTNEDRCPQCSHAYQRWSHEPLDGQPREAQEIPDLAEGVPRNADLAAPEARQQAVKARRLVTERRQESQADPT